MPDDVHGADEADTRLLDALRAAANRLDPVPPAVEFAARESFTWRAIDAELADLAYDSLLDDARLAGVRSGDAPRTLTFEAAALSVEVEVTEAGERRRLVGQIVPPQRAEVEIRHPGGTVNVEADEVGRFAADVGAGPVSLRCRVEEGDGPPLETAWVIV